MKRNAALGWFSKYKMVFASLAAVVGLSLIVALRYKTALSAPNFYAEDGTVFLENIMDHGIINATLTAFNGYLVVGMYLVADAAYATYVVLGLPFSSLPFLLALASCFFLGLTASLPFLVFRREMGWFMALMTSVFLALTPLPGSDFAIIGTIGNLKFAFLLWAVIFIIYRNYNYQNVKKTIFADVVLLICILTNGPVVALLPFILWPYRNDLKKMLIYRRLNKKFLKRSDVISATSLAVISATYLAVVYLKGIPKIPNYLDTPYNWGATGNIIYRVTEYGWLFPVSVRMTTFSAMAILAIILLLVLVFNRHRRVVFLFGLYAIAVSTVAFVATRPGVGEYMLLYEKFPDQFFYAQSMIFVFITMWVIAPYIRTSKQRLVALGVFAIFILISLPYGSSYGLNRELYATRPDIYNALKEACKNRKEEIVFPVYPNGVWNMKIDRDIACK